MLSRLLVTHCHIFTFYIMYTAALLTAPFYGIGKTKKNIFFSNHIFIKINYIVYEYIVLSFIYQLTDDELSTFTSLFLTREILVSISFNSALILSSKVYFPLKSKNSLAPRMNPSHPSALYPSSIFNGIIFFRV